MSGDSTRPAGWYEDPEDPGLKRYWTGSKWTEDRTPMIPAPTSTQSATTLVQVAKSTTVGVLLWLFLGNVGAHRHYVGKHASAVVQPIVFVIAWILISVGVQGDPLYTADGVRPPMVSYWSGLVLVGVAALWVFFDVFFIPGWIRGWIRDNAPRATIAETKSHGSTSVPPRTQYKDLGRSSTSWFDAEKPAEDGEIVGEVPWELRD